MQRFLICVQDISGSLITISDQKQIHHIKNVLCLKLKEKVIFFDGKGNEYLSRIEEFLPEGIIFKIERKHSFTSQEKLQITVASAIPKNAKMEDIIDKLTQLGVSRIIPLKTERMIVKLDKHKERLRLQRWNKIALSAAQQSQRNTLPIITPVSEIKNVLQELAGFDLKLIPTLMGRRKSLKEIFSQANPKNILVLIGPEGDFSPQEVELAIKAGCIPVSLGQLVLRVDTAAVAVVSFIKLYLQNQDPVL